MTRESTAPVRIGVISDTHGYLDPQVLDEFAGVAHIIHAGDVMESSILERLAEIAPVTAVAGNMDDGKLGKLPREVLVEVAGIAIAVGHKRKRLVKRLGLGKVDGVKPGDDPDAIVYGHDHIPAAQWIDGVLFLDPGSASAPHEEDDDPTIAVIERGLAGLAVTFVPLSRRPDAG